MIIKIRTEVFIIILVYNIYENKNLTMKRKKENNLLEIKINDLDLPFKVPDKIIC